MDRRAESQVFTQDLGTERVGVPCTVLSTFLCVQNFLQYNIGEKNHWSEFDSSSKKKKKSKLLLSVVLLQCQYHVSSCSPISNTRTGEHI